MSAYQVYKFFGDYGKISRVDNIWYAYRVKMLIDKPLTDAINQVKAMNAGIIIDYRAYTAPKRHREELIGLYTVPMASSLRQPPDPDSSLNIVNILCDDLLYKICEKASLSSMQLFEMAKVSSRFNAIAVHIFAHKYKDGLILCNEKPNWANWAPLWLVEEYLCMFGPLITSINTLNCNMNGNITFALITKYCTNVVKISCEFWDCTLPEVKCPKLLELNLLAEHMIDVPSTKAFCKLNSQLKALSLENVGSASDMDEIVRVLPNLEEFVVRKELFRCKDVTFVGTMQHLSTLTLDSMHISDVVRILNALVDANVQLKVLKLFAVEGTAYNLKCFKRLQSLETLEVHRVDDKERILEALTKAKIQLKTFKEIEQRPHTHLITDSMCVLEALQSVLLDRKNSIAEAIDRFQQISQNHTYGDHWNNRIM